MKYLLSGLFVLGVTVANLAVNHFGPWITPYMAFVLIGFEFSIRDYIHDVLESNKRLFMGGLILTAGVCTYIVNHNAIWIAIASSSAFVIANVVDFEVYERYIEQTYLVKSNLSNIFSTFADSITFVFIAFGFSWYIVGIALYQFVMKVCGGFFWSFIINKVRNYYA